MNKAIASLIDVLLASPLYGQRWGRHCFDVARFSDGFSVDFSTGSGFEDALALCDWGGKRLEIRTAVESVF